MSRSIVTEEMVKKEEPQHTTSLTFQDEYGTYSITVNDRDLTLVEVMDKLVIPVLTSAGYSREAFDEMMANL